MEINTNPHDRTDLKLVAPNAGWRFRATQARRRAEAEVAAQQQPAQNPQAPVAPAPEPALSK